MTGVGLAHHWKRDPSEVKRPGWDVSVVLANPRAAARATRYIDHDLNRCFLPRDLRGGRSGYEFERAREVVSESGGEDVLSRSVLFDLHTTTSNMGPTIILTTLSAFNLVLAYRLASRLPGLRVVTNPLERQDSPFVNGLSPFGFCIEVGPVAQGTVDPRIVALTRDILLAALDCCVSDLSADWHTEPFQRGLADQGSKQGEACLDVYEYAEVVDYPRYPDGSLSAMIHPERYGRDFVPIDRGSPLFLSWSGDVIRRTDGGVFWPIFAGESAYVEKETAMVLTKRKSIALGETLAKWEASSR